MNPNAPPFADAVVVALTPLRAPDQPERTVAGPAVPQPRNGRRTPYLRNRAAAWPPPVAVVTPPPKPHVPKPPPPKKDDPPPPASTAKPTPTKTKGGRKINTEL